MSVASYRPLSEQESATVQVSSGSGTIRIDAPALFTGRDQDAISRLVSRFFQESAVHSVAIDRDQQFVEVGYDPRYFTRSAALKTLSGRLVEIDESAAVFQLRQAIAELPGPMTLLQRRVAGGSEFRPAGPTAGNLNSKVLGNDVVAFYEPLLPAEVLRIADQPGENAATLSCLGDDSDETLMGRTVSGVRKLANLFAAAGCFAMAIIGVLTPGIPTVPFVLATGYFLARSSPVLHQKLRRSPFFGRMLTDYEDLGGLRFWTKVRAIAFAASILLVTAVLSAGAWPVVIVVFVMGGLGIYMVARIPTIRDDAAPQLAPV
ncbi:MAG: YbaN family protein [Planctomycetes bacterium]|nr:YbaN family protein [Planctomycetota bacterium]